ncbi:RGR1 [Candida pseudojiufengensis]|uniref:RGR1 n=1 Tax=Candida pseudojiufengensis TaxID=497109 RepID=UPI002224602F|nr:RGR1 [Candida pseudojiufengensis]KAI5964317.1 RGR1 [Candida pseudojiufengensis]
MEASTNGSLSNGNNNGNHTMDPKNNSSLPDIPHITENLIPLSNILRFYTQESYKQLTNAIENLSINVNNESDVKRKKYFLDIIIALRQDFLKIYTLVKWSNVAEDVSKFIDLLNWFRLQDFQFENLMFQLSSLNGFGGAKLPNFDIITALEVFYEGRPILPSHNYLKHKKITPTKTLEVLRDLNLILMTKFALIDIPKRFQYEIKDGRAYITVEKEFQVSVTLANDDIENDNSNPFYMIDFKFLFSMDIESKSIKSSSKNNNEFCTKLPTKSYIKLEKIANQTLLNSGLQGFYDLLHKYTISSKLFMIARQLKELMNSPNWKNNLQINYQTGNALIIVNYWSQQYLSSQWKSFIEIGFDRTFNLSYRWFKDGKYVSEDTINNIIQKDDFNNNEEINIESIITSFMLEHSANIMNLIASKFEERTLEKIQFLSPHQIMFPSSPKKSAILAINPVNGQFYFLDPTPIQSRIIKRINSPPSINKSFISEDDMANSVVEGLLQLKLETFTKEISNYLLTTEWINNSIIRLNEFEMNNLFKTINETEGYVRVQFYRRKHWPSTWFLIVMINGITNKTYWWVARIKSIEGSWVTNHSQNLHSNPELNYQFFINLGKFTLQKIINHVILEEIKSRNIKFTEINEEDESLKEIFANEAKDQSPSIDGYIIYKSMIKLENDDLLPLQISSPYLFLQIQLVNQTNNNNQNKMHVKLLGKLQNSTIKNSSELTKLNLKIDENNKKFEISTSIDLNLIINENSSSTNDKNFLNPIFDNLNKLNNLLKIMDQLNENKFQILDNSMDNIIIKLNDDIDKLIITLPEQSSSSIRLSTITTLNWEIELIINYLNQYLKQSKSTNIIGILNYLIEINPIIKSIKHIQQTLNQQQIINQEEFKLSNGLNKINFDAIFNNLNQFQFMFNISSTIPNTKKIQKDKILISISFKPNKYSTSKKSNLLKISFKNNLNLKNIKFKKLFELIFKNINEMERNKQDEIIKFNESNLILKLNYDFLISLNLIEEIMNRITKCFLQYLKEL